MALSLPRAAAFAALAPALALGAVLAVPAAASASTIYPPTGSCTTPAAAQAGSTITFECDAETFSADESITVTVTGANGADARIGMVRFAITTASSIVTSEADGSLEAVDIALPANASGTYNIAAVSASSAGGTAAVTIAGADGLPTTGLDQSQTLALWIGGSAILLAGAALAVVAAVRRSRDSE